MYNIIHHTYNMLLTYYLEKVQICCILLCRRRTRHFSTDCNSFVGYVHQFWSAWC